MKIRKGFVSNSSSSSYIIAIDNGEPCEHCGRSDPDIIAMIERSSADSESRVDAVGKETVIKYIDDEWAEYEDEGRYDEWKAKIMSVPDNKKVGLISVSYHDEFLASLLRESNSIEIIEKCY